MQYSSELFVKALQENSDVENDWLWLATKLSDNTQREFCFEKALHLNPHSETARRGLALVQRAQEIMKKKSLVEEMKHDLA